MTEHVAASRYVGFGMYSWSCICGEHGMVPQIEPEAIRAALRHTANTRS